MVYSVMAVNRSDIRHKIPKKKSVIFLVDFFFGSSTFLSVLNMEN